MGVYSYLMGNVAIRNEEMVCQNAGEWQKRIWEEVRGGGKERRREGRKANGVENFTNSKTSSNWAK